MQKILFERGEERLKERDADVELQQKEAAEMANMQEKITQVRQRNQRAALRVKPKGDLTEEEREFLKWDFILHPHLFFGVETVGFDPPNVDKKANAKKDEYIGKGKFQKRIAPLKTLDPEHLLFIRSAEENELLNEIKLPFQLKKFKTMRGTESQILHVRNLLMEYGWDDYDAPEFESQKKKDKKKA